MLSTLHLVRHGEVLNPDHVVYADLEGFGLSSLGMAQARSTAAHLADESADAIVSSPLQRARETADPIATSLGLDTGVDTRLTEWHLGRRWAGVVWEDLPNVFPGELEAYLATPTGLDFALEQIADVAVRMVAAVNDLGDRHPSGTAIVVSHQDPVQAVRLTLTGRDLATLHDDKPGHASIITLHRDGDGWVEASFWSPDQASNPFPPVKGPKGT